MLHMSGLAFKNFNFILTPMEMENIFEEYHLMSCTSVPVSYTETPIAELIDAYSALHSKLSAGEKLIHSDDWRLYPSFKVTNDLSLCPYNEPHIYNEKKMKSPNFDLSVPSLEPFTLIIHGGIFHISESPSASSVIGQVISHAPSANCGVTAVITSGM